MYKIVTDIRRTITYQDKLAIIHLDRRKLFPKN